MNSYQTEYLRIWKKAFAEFLGWSEEQTTSWAQPLLADMDPPGMVINEPPLYYVARELAWAQPFMDDLSQRGREELIHAIENILAPSHDRSFASDFDFGAARRQIDKLVHGAKPRQ